MSAGREVEAKLVVIGADPDAVLGALATRDSIGPVRLGPARESRIRDVYFDTPGGALRRWGGALRVRLRDGRRLVTVKGPAREAGPGVDRAELELELTEENLRRAIEWTRTQTGPADLPARPRLDARAPSIGGMARIHDRRTRRIVRDGVAPGGERVELALDRAIYVIGGREVTIAEVEVEAVGEDAPVAQVVAAMLEAFGGSLRPWRVSKLAAGLALQRLEARSELAGLPGRDGRLGPEAIAAVEAEADRAAGA